MNADDLWILGACQQCPSSLLGIVGDIIWKKWWRNLAVMPLRQYDVTGGNVRKLFMQAMSEYLALL